MVLFCWDFGWSCEVCSRRRLFHHGFDVNVKVEALDAYGEEEREVFFDSQEALDVSVYESGRSEYMVDASDSGFLQLDYGIWMREPGSVHDRRQRFLSGIWSDGTIQRDEEFRLDSRVELRGGMDPWNERNGAAVLRNSVAESVGYSDITLESPNSNWGESFVDFSRYSRSSDLDQVMASGVSEFREGGSTSTPRSSEEGGLTPTTESSGRSNAGWSSDDQIMRRESCAGTESDDVSTKEMKRRRKSWWKSLRSVLGIANKPSRVGCSSDDSVKGSIVRAKLGSDSVRRKMKVEHHQKQFKDFSALYMGQEIHAHKGIIWTMKFSPDGQFLATGGEDGVVRVWCITRIRSVASVGLGSTPSLVDIIKKDLEVGKKEGRHVPVMIPEEMFNILEKPLHEFRGHTSDVLDLSWSNNKYLLSSSADNTVRLWQIGSSSCVKVFQHNNYVTCVQFNPANDNCFATGSIDGKIRVWDIPACQVVNWADVRDIVTALSYQPDGQGIVVGSISGQCRFYDASGQQLQLTSQMSLGARKRLRSGCKQITGFEFSSKDNQKVMVTSADSCIRIIDGSDVVLKYRGLRKFRGLKNASFTCDGRHIISSSDDSRLYIWKFDSPDTLSSKQSKSIRSCEHFFSGGITVAAPWSCPPEKTAMCNNNTPRSFYSHQRQSNNFFLGNGFFTDGLSRSSVTWPEEKLLPHNGQESSSVPTTCGLVIVTANCDGVLRAFHNYGLPVRV